MEGFSRINRSGVVFSRVDREDVRGPQHLKEHTLLYIRSGRAEVICVTDEHGVPIPKEVQITGTLDEAQRQTLSAVITNDIGVPTSGQRFREG